MQHKVVADGHAARGRVAGEGRVLGQKMGLVEEVTEQGAQFLALLGPDGIEEVAQAGGRRGVAILEAEEAPPARSVLARQELGQSGPTTALFATQAKAQKKGEGIERGLAFSRLDVELGEVVAQGREVDQA